MRERLSDKGTGFSERLINGETWRVFTVEDGGKGVRVLVGDRLGLRDHFVAEIMKGVLAPMALTVPLLGFLIWASLSRGLETGKIPTEIRPVIRSLNSLFARVQDALRHERDITAFAAHELRTPLAGLRMQAQIAIAARDETTRTAALRQILVGVDRTTRLVRQLLAIAKLDSAPDAIPARQISIT